MRLRTGLLTTAFATTIPAANWLIGHIGTECIPNGPCILPVGFGLSAPSGVLVVGVALVLRDMVQEAGGMRSALVAIGVGGVASWLLASPALVAASVAAFLIAELADLAVYTPLRKRNLVGAIMASGFVGSIIDSAVFLWLAFGSLTFIEGQVVGKLWMSVVAAALVWLWREIRVGDIRWKTPEAKWYP